ncbi:MAG: PAS domain S-box protein [Candidatus Manganitrophus sp.]|nr:PAS domain S-box protein [Candidatus Manganitrophus sp.]
MNHFSGLFRHLSESAILGVFFWDGEGNITEANDAFLKMVGSTREDLTLGRLRWRDMTPEEYRPLLQRALQELATTGVCAPFEKEYIGPDGRRRSILIEAVLQEGSQDRGVGFVLDLPDQKKMQRALRESEARMEAILEISFDCIITIDHKGKVLEFNPAAESTFGYRRSEVIGKELAELIIPPSLRERHRAGLARYLTSGEGRGLDRRIEMTAMRADGSEFPVELKVTPVLSEGPPIFTGSVRDISERKWSEQERHRLAFQEREARADAEEVRQQMAFLAEASRLMASSFDDETALSGMARLAVPYFADGCVVDLLEADQTLRRLAVAAADPAKEQLGRELIRRFPPDLNGQHPIQRALQTGGPIFIPEITDEMIASLTWDEEHSKIARSLGLKSAIVVPLLAGKCPVGVISFVRTGGRRYRPADLAVAEDLARQASMAVQNARLFRASQEETQANQRGKK